MPPEIAQDQALSLKKRARRRLVGAIALVLLMLVILPQILQDRVATNQQEAISIVMPKPLQTLPLDTPHNPTLNHEDVTGSDQGGAPISHDAVVENALTLESLIAEKEQQAAKPQQKIANVTEKVTKAESSASPGKIADTVTQKKIAENFVVQIGVYSDAANVKRLQDQLKKAGFSTITEKVSTSKGEGVRLKVGLFGSRQAAADALAKIKEIGLSGIVILNE